MQFPTWLLQPEQPVQPVYAVVFSSPGKIRRKQWHESHHEIYPNTKTEVCQNDSEIIKKIFETG